MILLLSGGLDSIAAWRLLNLPTAVHFDLETRSRGREHEAIFWAQERFDARVVFRDMHMSMFEQLNGYLPFRNPLLILAAAQLDPDVAIGQIAEWAPDKNSTFYRRLEKTVNMTGFLAGFEGNLKIHAPFAHLSKGRLIRAYAEEFGVYEADALLKNTWSCYQNGAKHCGKCGGCVQRWNAEAHYARLMAFPLGGALSDYAQEPPFVPTPGSDRLRQLRDNGLLGVQQLRERRRQNASAKMLHKALGPGFQSNTQVKRKGLG